MSTRRWHRINSALIGPVWLYGSDSETITWSSGLALISARDSISATYAAYGTGGIARATSDLIIAAAGASIGLLVTALNKVDQSTLGAFKLPGTLPQSLTRPSSRVPSVISSAPYLLVSGNIGYYFKGGTDTACASIALIDMTTGALAAGFTALNTTFVYPSVSDAVPLLFSDGGSRFGIYNLITSNPVLYGYSFSTIIPSGVGTSLGMFSDYVGGTSISAPLAKYGTTGFSGPITISSSGAYSAAFSSARMSLCAPVYDGSKWFQSSIVSRPSTDPAYTPPTPTTAGQVDAIFSSSVASGVLTAAFIASLYPPTQADPGGFGYMVVPGSYSVSGTYVLSGGWFGDAVNITIGEAFTIGNSGGTGDCFIVSGSVVDSGLAGVVTAIQSLFPGLTISSSTTASNTYPQTIFGANPTPTATAVTVWPMFQLSISLPSWASQLPTTGFDQLGNSTGAKAISPPSSYVCISSDGGAVNDYTFAAGGVTPAPSDVHLAANGSLVCHSFYQEGRSVINLLGVTKLAVFDAPIWDIVPFKTGFAIIVNSTSSGYYVLGKTMSGVPVHVMSPILIINSAGALDTSTMTAIYTNFFSLSRSDGATYAPLSLAKRGSNLTFNSRYMPTYINMSAAAANPTAPYQDLVPAPTVSPFVAPGAGVDVICECDTSGARVLP